MKLDSMLDEDGQKYVTYICCDYCGKPMQKSWICLWTQEKNGQPHNVTFLHYHCQQEFELENAGKGLWWLRHIPAWRIDW